MASRLARNLRRAEEIEYGIKELLQGLFLGFIIGFLVATQLADKYVTTSLVVGLVALGIVAAFVVGWSLSRIR